MTVLGYWASQEQYSMQNLLEFVGQAEKGGFTPILTSDHFHLGGMTMGLAILHGFGWPQLPNELRK
jgi:alkanesulfonate monooxygenase SsuD/methylene tetrahydromethanopterin reductase-like flavin-dependent oxidoreductase (luciferase family)